MSWISKIARSTWLSLICLVIAVGLVASSSDVAWAQAAPNGQPQQQQDSGVFGSVLDSIKSTFLFDRPTMEENLKKYQDSFSNIPCWSCAVFSSFGQNVFTKGNQVANSASGPMQSVLAAFGSLFALFYLGSAFASGDASDLLSRWKVFWKLCIAVACGSAVLEANAFEWVWRYIYGPLASIPLAVANAFGGGSAGGCSPGAIVSGAPPGASGITQSMGGIVCGGHKISMKGLGTAVALAFSGDGILNTVINVIIAGALGIIFTWIAVTFPLNFIDCLLRLMVVGVVAPVLVVCAVFKPTRSLVRLGISNVLYAANLFAFTSIMFSLGESFFNQMITEQTQNMGSLDLGGMAGRAITLIGAGVVFGAMLRMAPTLAAEFSQFSGSSGGVGEAAHGAISNTASFATKSVSGGTRGVAGYAWNNSRFGEAGRISRSVEAGLGNYASSGAAALGKGVT